MRTDAGLLSLAAAFADELVEDLCVGRLHDLDDLIARAGQALGDSLDGVVIDHRSPDLAWVAVAAVHIAMLTVERSPWIH
jgi:hypothetical protein